MSSAGFQDLPNGAWGGHPVIQEIVRRKKQNLTGDPRSANGLKLGLVVEGGGMRGVYSGGALVTMEQLGLSGVFDEVYGESAGAMNSCYFLARQASFGISIYLDHLPSLRFINPFRFGAIIDVSYAIDVVVTKVKPLDVERVLSAPSDLYIAMTNALTGEPRLVDVKRDALPLLSILKATGAIVPLYNRPAYVGDTPYVDGGITNPVPVRSAIEGGCTHILVLLSRPLDFKSIPFTRLQRVCMRPLLRSWSASLATSFFERRPGLYNAARDLAFGKTTLRPDCQIAVMAPVADSPRIQRATVSRQRLRAAMEDAAARARVVFQEL